MRNLIDQFPIKIATTLKQGTKFMPYGSIDLDSFYKFPINKLMSVFYASVVLFMINCVIKLSKCCGNHKDRCIKNHCQFVFYTNKNIKMVNCQVKMRGKDAVNSCKHFCQIDMNIVNSFSHFLMGYLQRSIKFHWLKSWLFDSWNFVCLYVE